MKSRYDGTESKDRVIANARQAKFEAEHNYKNSFVKKVQAEQARHQGRHPNLHAECMEFNAHMTFDGVEAQNLGRMATEGMDRVAYPFREPAKVK